MLTMILSVLIIDIVVGILFVVYMKSNIRFIKMCSIGIDVQNVVGSVRETAYYVIVVVMPAVPAPRPSVWGPGVPGPGTLKASMGPALGWGRAKPCTVGGEGGGRGAVTFG